VAARRDGFRIVLTAELAEVVERRLNGSVTAFLGEHGLTVDDIGSWICHQAARRCSTAAQRALKLPDQCPRGQPQVPFRGR